MGSRVIPGGVPHGSVSSPSGRQQAVRELQSRWRWDRWRGRSGGRRWRAIRRLLAAALIVLAGFSASWQAAARPGTSVLVATRDLALGSVIAVPDVAIVRILDPPDGALVTVDQIAGRRLTAAARRGEVLTDVRLIDPLGPDPGPGRVAITVRPADPAVTQLLQPGMAVSVLGVGASGTVQTLAAEAMVLAVLDESPGRADAGRPVLLAVPTANADLVTAGTLAGDIAVRLT